MSTNFRDNYPEDIWKEIIDRLPCDSVLCLRKADRYIGTIVYNSLKYEYAQRLQAAGLEEREGHARFEDVSDCLHALRKYNHRWERRDIRSKPLPDDAIPKGFLVHSVEEGCLTSFMPRGGLDVTTYHYFASSNSIPTIPVEPERFSIFNHRAGLSVIVQVNQLERSVKAELFRISTESKGWLYSKHYELKGEFCYKSAHLTSRRFAIIVYVADAFALKKIFVWDLEGKPYLENTTIALNGACFIDEYRLLGAVPSRSDPNKSELALWDTSHKNPSPVRFETEHPSTESTHLRRNREPNHKLPFHGDLSEGIVCVVTPVDDTGALCDVLVIRVRDLIALSKRRETVLWSEWKSGATNLSNLPSNLSVLHSQVGYVHRDDRTPVLYIHDFSRHLERDDESNRDGPLNLICRTPTIRNEIKLLHKDMKDPSRYTFALTEGGVYAILVEEGEVLFFPF